MGRATSARHALYKLSVVPTFVALCDKAFEALGRSESLSEPALLAAVYGGQPPAALYAQLATPLLQDPRLERRADGCWVRRSAASLADEVTVLALATTGPTPGRGRIVHIGALHVAGESVLQRFIATVHPGARVPTYVATRLGIEPGVLNELPPLDAVFDTFVQFLGARPVAAQDALLTWSFIDAEARRRGTLLGPQLLIDVNEMARASLDDKPTLSRVAQSLGVAVGRVEHPDEEARVLALVVPRLLRQDGRVASVLASHTAGTESVLRRGTTARALPDQPGIYVLRSADQQALYVGKARRLRSRMQAYVHRPLGPTRRLEGLVGAVDAVDSALCETDLEALVLEEREIRRLQPRFNTVRRQREPRTWLCLPLLPAPGRAPRRIQVCARRGNDEADYLGPFRNEAAAEHARQLARAVFELDHLRRIDRLRYEPALLRAWSFLQGDLDPAVVAIRERQRAAATSADSAQLRQCERLLAAVHNYDVGAQLLPADPREARYAVVRPCPSGVEGFLIDRGVLVQYTLMQEDDATRFAVELLTPGRPRTSDEDISVALRWLGGNRAPARLILVVDEQSARDAIEDAAFALRAVET
ncbi:MAG: hypothetical protein JOZ81_25530 [Chloroflexi bacterium]|nr:hypothetical protein [Chloroflexota bacterium]